MGDLFHKFLEDNTPSWPGCALFVKSEDGSKIRGYFVVTRLCLTKGSLLVNGLDWRNFIKDFDQDWQLIYKRRI